MNKTILVLLFLSFYTFSSAQLGFENKYDKATIYFKNGKSTHGYARFIGNKIKFKKNKKTKRIIYGANELIKIYISKNRKDHEYHYKFIKGRKKAVLLELVKEGSVTLYRIIDEGNRMVMGINGGFVGMHYYTITSYYVAKHDETILTHLGAKGSLFSKNFKKAASKYFNDCPMLVWMIKNKELKKRDIVEVVEYYNKNCGEKSTKP